MSEQRFSIELYHSMKPSRFSVLRRLEVLQTSDYKSSSVEVTLELARPEIEHSEGGTLTLKFDGVRNLRLDQGTWSQMQFPLLEIRDIRDRGWEGLSYQVVDNEHGIFGCLCKNIVIDTNSKKTD